MDEKKRIEKAVKTKKPLRWTDTPNGIKLIHKVRLKGVKFDLDRKRLLNLKCYLYKVKDLGISEHNFEQEFEGKTLLVYENTNLILHKRSKCNWCFSPTENFLVHISEAHNKTSANVIAYIFQQKLYRELLKIVRETPYYFSIMFLNDGCQYCDNPILKGRELCCSIPTSFRDRARSLKLLGMSAKNLEEKYLTTPNMGQIIIAP